MKLMLQYILHLLQYLIEHKIANNNKVVIVKKGVIQKIAIFCTLLHWQRTSDIELVFHYCCCCSGCRPLLYSVCPRTNCFCPQLLERSPFSTTTSLSSRTTCVRVGDCSTLLLYSKLQKTQTQTTKSFGFRQQTM